MNKNSNIIIRIDSDLKEEAQRIAKKEKISLSSLINAYLLDTVSRGMIPINIKAKAGRLSKHLPAIDIPTIKKNLDEIIKISHLEQSIEKAYIFGSYARGEATIKSDVDIRIVTKKGEFSLIDLGNLRLDLVDKLGVDIDIVAGDKEDLDPLFYNEIKKDEICIYESKN